MANGTTLPFLTKIEDGTKDEFDKLPRLGDRNCSRKCDITDSHVTCETMPVAKIYSEDGFFVLMMHLAEVIQR